MLINRILPRFHRHFNTYQNLFRRSLTSSTRHIEIYQVDAFTSDAFRGNPASVAVLPSGVNVTRQWMSHVAAEMNSSETAFIQRVESESDDSNTEIWSIRWIEPDAQEISLCAHAALASAHVLWEHDLVDTKDSITFKPLSHSLLHATRKTNKNGNPVVEMQFPADIIIPLFGQDSDTLSNIYDALGLQPEDVIFTGKNRLDYAIEVKSQEKVADLKPSAIALSSAIDHRGVMVTAKADDDKDYQFVSRFFAPNVDRPEDPVTGTSHCGLGPYWTQKLHPDYVHESDENPDGGPWVCGYQASNRGGHVYVKWIGDNVLLAGESVTIFKAILDPPVEEHVMNPAL